ncbi:hypothetical protein G6F51_009985 [Rhizopus arrhizus]|uniref:protein kinase C n=2 Tax=Rhizopus TaxID=4842 RepID=A0A9P6Y362_RHIOR|nr:hypothetical protein G6F51_009985 [Rhizopus arrhizus]
MAINELKAKIEHNRIMRDKFIQMRPLLKDKNVISDCETQIKEYQKYIDYFTEELARIESKKELSPQLTPNLQPPRTNLLMSETPYNKPKVSLKLHELEYKLDVEKTVLKGIKGMAEVLEKSVDRRNRTDIQDKMYESMEKLSLLNSALRKYKSLYIGEGGDEDDYELETPPSARLPPGFRRPVTGKLQLEILEACELAHAPTRLIRTPATIILVKIDNQVVFRSRPARNDKWNELCETHVNKASEIEIGIYDQSPEKSLPIGILWLKITDITEGLRKRKVPQWMLAQQQQLQKKENEGESNTAVGPTPIVNSAGAEGYDNGIEAWFDVEPVGKIAFRLNFVRADGNRRPMDKLGRAGAVRQRREEVVEVNGHQFLENRFYNVMKCALCQEFFVNSGYQCEDCEYTCHKKCSSKVVTKCMANSTETVSDEDKLNHKIPHRFEPITNIGANWCCHCGYMLPLGSRGAKKCSECDITAHTRCERRVPDFCGLSMEMANQMLAEIKAAAKRQKAPESKPRIEEKEKEEEKEAEETLGSQLNQLTIIEPPPPPPPKSPVVVPQTPPTMYNNAKPQPPYPPQQQQQQQQPQPYPPQHPQSYPLQQQQPYPHQQSHYSPHHPPVGIPQPGRMYPPQQQGPPLLPPHVQSPYGQSPHAQSPYGQPPHVDPRYQQQYYPPQQQQMRPQMVYSPQQQQQMMRPPVSPYQQQQIVPQGQPMQPQKNRKVALENFSFLAVLGKAVLMLFKSVRSEKRVFQAANRARHPFLISLHSTFQTESRVYFVTEYVSGGDLMWHIQRGQFSERRAKFYACEVLLALEYFHSQGIIYRDLKLDNIMLGLDGHIKMADYGLCKENMGYGRTTGTFCGTPEFMAPEILKEQNYGRAVDWWAYGVLIYEMLLGQSPFRGEDEDEIFDAILEDDILYPINMSSDSISICQQLLQRDPNRRLGGGPDDAVPIKQHPFFRGVVWEDMLAKRIPPPFYPSVTGRLDTSNFDEEFTNEIPALTPIDATLNRIEQQEFQNFSYVAEWAT